MAMTALARVCACMCVCVSCIRAAVVAVESEELSYFAIIFVARNVTPHRRLGRRDRSSTASALSTHTCTSLLATASNTTTLCLCWRWCWRSHWR